MRRVRPSKKREEKKKKKKEEEEEKTQKEKKEEENSVLIQTILVFIRVGISNVGGYKKKESNTT